jgi:hypothetical protein
MGAGSAGPHVAQEHKPHHCGDGEKAGLPDHMGGVGTGGKIMEAWKFNREGNFTTQFNNRERCFWMVWGPDFGPASKRHLSSMDARLEAQRLAEENPGHRYYVFMSDSSFEVAGKMATIFQGSGIPNGGY